MHRLRAVFKTLQPKFWSWPGCWLAGDLTSEKNILFSGTPNSSGQISLPWNENSTVCIHVWCANRSTKWKKLWTVRAIGQCSNQSLTAISVARVCTRYATNVSNRDSPVRSPFVWVAWLPLPGEWQFFVSCLCVYWNWSVDIQPAPHQKSNSCVRTSLCPTTAMNLIQK